MRLDLDLNRGILGLLPGIADSFIHMTKWIMGVAVIAVIAGGVYWYFFTRPAHTPAQDTTQQTVPQGPDTSDQGLAQDLADIDAQAALNVDASADADLPAQVSQTGRIADLMSNLALKLSMRVSALGTTSPQAAALQGTLSDLNSKIADAHTQATAASGHISKATDSTSSMSTTAQEYAKAHADMRVAKQDFAAARADITTLFAGLNITATATSTVPTTTTATTTL